MTKAPESRMICLMLVPPVPMMAPTAALGTLIWHSSADWTEETRPWDREPDARRYVLYRHNNSNHVHRPTQISQTQMRQIATSPYQLHKSVGAAKSNFRHFWSLGRPTDGRQCTDVRKLEKKIENI